MELEKGRRKKIEPSNEEVNESSQFQFLFPTLRRRSRRRIDSPQYFSSRQSLLSIEKSRSNPRVQKSIELHKNTSLVREVEKDFRGCVWRVYSPSILSPPLSPSFKIRQTFATLFENSLLPPFTLERTLDHPFCIHARNHPLHPCYTRVPNIFSIQKKRRKEKLNYIHFVSIDSSIALVREYIEIIYYAYLRTVSNRRGKKICSILNNLFHGRWKWTISLEGLKIRGFFRKEVMETRGVDPEARWLGRGQKRHRASIERGGARLIIVLARYALVELPC